MYFVFTPISQLFLVANFVRTWNAPPPFDVIVKINSDINNNTLISPLETLAQCDNWCGHTHFGVLITGKYSLLVISRKWLAQWLQFL